MAISKTIPTYRQLDPNGFFCEAGYLILENEAFEYEGEPNEQMEALNEPARLRLVEYYKKLDKFADEYERANGRTFKGGRKPLDVWVAEATADARRVQLRPGDGGIPLTSAKNESKVTVRKVELGETDSVLRLNKSARNVHANA